MFCKLQILVKELFIILPQSSHRFQRNEVPFLKLIFVYLNIKLSHSVNGSNVWGSFGTFWWCPPLVQMEYLTTKEVLSLQNWHNWRQSANPPGKKIIAECHLEFSYSYRYYTIILYFTELVNFSHKYSIWTRGGRHQKVPNEPQTLDPFTEWLNFIFKYTNIYFKK